jgi:hypothetical protein
LLKRLKRAAIVATAAVAALTVSVPAYAGDIIQEVPCGNNPLNSGKLYIVADNGKFCFEGKGSRVLNVRGVKEVHTGNLSIQFYYLHKDGRQGFYAIPKGQHHTSIRDWDWLYFITDEWRP